MRKIILGLILVVIVVAAIFGWLILGPSTAFGEGHKYLYVATGKANSKAVIDSIEKNDLISNTSIFNLVAGRFDVWERLKPGRYKIEKGQSILSIARMLRNNQQSPVNLVINKIRTKEDLAKVIGKNFEADSTDVLDFLNNSDSLAKIDVNEDTWMTVIIPNTYTLFWTTSPSKVLRRLKSESESFWDKKNRKEKAQEMGFSPTQVLTIASIVEEETNKNDEKGNIASVYINRYHKGMPLGADPTVKFALKDFSIKRIL